MGDPIADTQMRIEWVAVTSIVGAMLVPLSQGVAEASRKQSAGGFQFTAGAYLGPDVDASSIILATARAATVGTAALALVALLLLVLSPGSGYSRVGRFALWSVLVGGLGLALLSGIAAVDQVFPHVFQPDDGFGPTSWPSGVARAAGALPYVGACALSVVVAWCASSAVHDASPAATVDDAEELDAVGDAEQP